MLTVGHCTHLVLKIALSALLVCMCVYLRAASAPRLLITSGMIRIPHDCMVKQVLQLHVAAVVGIISRCGLSIDPHHRNQPNKSKLELYKPSIHFSNHLKQLYISNKMECFSYKGG